jgi:hypothetical protein
MVAPIVDHQESGLLARHGIKAVFHYAPLHYLVFIARARALYSKNTLRACGYISKHFRSTSRRADELRGFSDYVHLTLTAYPPILEAKLDSGFPHFEIRIPVSEIEAGTFHLCRYNIAKSRYLRRGSASGPVECAANGWYQSNKQLPTAETAIECDQLLRYSFGHRMIEVLIPRQLSLGPQTELLFFDDDDLALAQKALAQVNAVFSCQRARDKSYRPTSAYKNAVSRFLERAIGEAEWKGDGLEFDRV